MKRREREQMKKKKNIYKEWKKKWTFRCKWRAWLCGLTFTNNPSSPYTKTRLHTHHNVSVFLIDEKKKKSTRRKKKKIFLSQIFSLTLLWIFFFFFLPVYPLTLPPSNHKDNRIARLSTFIRRTYCPTIILAFT